MNARSTWAARHSALFGFVCLALAPSATLAQQPQAAADMQTVYYDYVDESGRLAGGWVTLTIEPGPLMGNRELDRLYGLDVEENRIDLVMVGDGYMQHELARYAAHARSVVSTLFVQEPFRTYEPLFAVHRVDVVSNESGVDHDPVQGIWRDTALDMGFWCGGTERLLCVNVSKAFQHAQNAPDVDMVLAVANSTKYGGAGYSQSSLATVAGGNGSAAEVAIHEIGHGLGKLADEYSYGGAQVYTGPEPGQRNVSTFDHQTMAANGRKWADWLGVDRPEFDGFVSTYEGAMYHQFGIYRPTQNSKMRSLNRPFNLPSAEGLIIEVYKIVAPIDDATPTGQTLTVRDTAFVDPVDPAGHALDIQWSLDGTAISGATGETLELALLQLLPGQYTLSVTVVDNTDMVRDAAARQAWLAQTLHWDLQIAGCRGDLNGDGVVDLADLGILLADFDCTGGNCAGDVDGDGDTDLADLGILLAEFGNICP